MGRFQFSLRRLLLLVLFICAGLAFAKAAFAPSPRTLTATQIPVRFAYSVIAAAAFGAAAGTALRNVYNGFAIGVFTAFLLYILAFFGLARLLF